MRVRSQQASLREMMPRDEFAVVPVVVVDDVVSRAWWRNLHLCLGRQTTYYEALDTVSRTVLHRRDPFDFLLYLCTVVGSPEFDWSIIADQRSPRYGIKAAGKKWTKSRSAETETLTRGL